MWYLDKWNLAVIINSSEEFSVAANKFEPSIATLFQKEKDLLCDSICITRFYNNIEVSWCVAVSLSDEHLNLFLNYLK